jgi:hypothetical protein
MVSASPGSDARSSVDGGAFIERVALLDEGDWKQQQHAEKAQEFGRPSNPPAHVNLISRRRIPSRWAEPW